MAAPQAPGWYPDEADGTALRYWDGQAWTGAKRPRPPWSDAAGPGDNGNGKGAANEAGGAPRSRRKWFVLAGLAVLAAIAFGVAMAAIRAPSPGPRVLTDTAFVARANTLCRDTMPTLRPPDNGPFGSLVTPAQTADRIDQVAAGLDELAARLRAIPAALPDQPHIAGWLAIWARYTAEGRTYADWLRRHGFANPGSVLSASNRDQHQADNFALANGLKDCTFFTIIQGNPENGI